MVLAAVAGALRTLLTARGEQLGDVAITVPVAARRAATGGELGNQIGIMPDPSRMPDAPALAAALRHELPAPLIAPLP